MRLVLLTIAALLAAGCGSGSPAEPATTAAAGIAVSSTAFRDGGTIPRRYTCDGASTSPPLAWSGLPASTKSLAIVVDDPDAPNGTFTHWVLVDLAPETTELAEGTTPPGAKQVSNSAGEPSYAGPCPPSGTHHYRFTVYALSKATGLADGAGLDEALKAIDADTVARGRLTAVYGRQ